MFKIISKKHMQVLFAKAKKCEQNQNINGAKIIYLKILKNYAGNINAWVSWLKFLLRSNQIKEALFYSTKALNLFPNNPMLTDIQISLYLACEQYGKAYDLVNKLHHEFIDYPINFDRLSRIHRFALSAVCEGIEKDKLNEQTKIQLVSKELKKHFTFLKELFDARKTKLIFIIGNCQSWPLMRILNTNNLFGGGYFTTCYKTIHTMSNIEQVAVSNILNIFDIVLTQNIRSSSKYEPLVTKDLKKKFNNNILTYPTCFFSSYFPDAFPASGIPGPQFPFGLHSLNVFSSFDNKLSLEDAVKNFEICKIDGKIIQHVHDINLNEMNDRDAFLDIKIRDFIIKNYQKSLLFYTFNHCSVEVLGYIANQIFDRLSLSHIDTDLSRYEGLDGAIWHVSDEIKKYLGLTFSRNYFVLNKVKLSNSEFVKRSYKYYFTLDSNSIHAIKNIVNVYVNKHYNTKKYFSTNKEKTNNKIINKIF